MTEEKRPVGHGDGKTQRLGELRLLIAFDALLREGSVSRAAASMGLQTSAMSRLLAQLREKFEDPLFTRTGQGLVPTPFAEAQRLRLRAIAAETDGVLNAPSSGGVVYNGTGEATGWERPSLFHPPPLATRPDIHLEGQPSPSDIARKLARIGHNAPPQQRLAKYIATIGPGPGRSRPLDQKEAQDALGIILDGEADGVQIGALMSIIQYRGGTADEFAGFVRAMRSRFQSLPKLAVDLDWPCYISPKSQTQPWFMHAARLVADAGYRVLLHGGFGDGPLAGKLELAAQSADIPVCRSLAEAADVLGGRKLAFLPLACISAQLYRLIALYHLVEMRLPVFAVRHLLNPLDAGAILLGIATPSYRELHRDVAKLLGFGDLSIVGSNRDFAQAAPHRPTQLYRLVGGAASDLMIPAQQTSLPQPVVGLSSREYWQAIWTGAARDERAETIITMTAAVALMTIERLDNARFDEVHRRAIELWRARSR